MGNATKGWVMWHPWVCCPDTTVILLPCQSSNSASDPYTPGRQEPGTLVLPAPDTEPGTLRLLIQSLSFDCMNK